MLGLCIEEYKVGWGKTISYLDYSLTPKEFNSYGARRGNDDIMSRGTFANIRLVNKLVSKSGPRTVHVPSGEEVLRMLLSV